MRHFSGLLLKITTLILLATGFSGCTHKETNPNKPTTPPAEQKSSTPEISQEKICFLMIDIETGQIFNSLNEEFCSEQLPAGYTFNLPLYLMVLEEQISLPKATNINLLLKNDQKDKSKLILQLVEKLSFEKLRQYLRSFEYGNLDLSAGYEKVGVSQESRLKISGFEQSSFLRNLARNKLSIKPANSQITLSKLTSTKDKKGSVLYGKTSWLKFKTNLEEQSTQELSWYVGYLKKGTKQYSLVTAILKDTEPDDLENKKAPLKNEAFIFTVEKLQEINSWSPGK